MLIDCAKVKIADEIPPCVTDHTWSHYTVQGGSPDDSDLESLILAGLKKCQNKSQFNWVDCYCQPLVCKIRGTAFVF